MKQISIGNTTVGEGQKTFIIAELSANHGQRLDVAIKTIEAAAKAGADAIKLQTYTPDTLTLDSNKEHFVVRTTNAWAGRKLYDLYRDAMTPWEWHAELKSAAESHGLLWFSTPFDETAVEFLSQLDAPAFKIASFEIVDLPLVERVARKMKPVIISTGMASLSEIEAAVGVCREVGNEQIVLLRCVSSYPAKPESMDLRSMALLSAFGTIVGLSDHTRDSTVAIASVALGARVIEKHFILDRSVGGPDSFFSLEPSEFASMVAAVRDAEKALGRVRFGPGDDERASVAFRRSLFVTRDVAAGEVLTADHVRSVRPSHGLAPRFLPTVLGRPATRAIEAASPLQWDMVGAAPELLPALVLRAANMSDAERLLEWRNDEQTRNMSGDQSVVQIDSHRTWLEKKLASEHAVIWIAELDGAAAGVLRYDRLQAEQWVVSITVAPEMRGRGLATAFLRVGEAAMRQRGAVSVVAHIKEENVASLKAFKSAGFYGFTSDARVWRCERRLRDF